MEAKQRNNTHLLTGIPNHSFRSKDSEECPLNSSEDKVGIGAK